MDASHDPAELAEDDYRAGTIDRAGLISRLEEIMRDDPERRAEIENRYAWAWHDDTVEMRQIGE